MSSSAQRQQTFIIVYESCGTSTCKNIQLPIGSYKNSQLTANGLQSFANKIQISSIIIPPGISVILYENDSFDGRRYELKGNSRSENGTVTFDLSTVSMPNPKNVNDKWVNNVESLEVKML